MLTSEKASYDDGTSKHKSCSTTLREKIKGNHEKQEELRRQLKVLEEEERDLMAENEKENEQHVSDTKVKYSYY